MITQEERTRTVLIELLAKVLDQTKWSMTKLAEVAGVNQTTITRFLKTGAREGGMNAVTIAKITAASGIAPPVGLGAELPMGFSEVGIASYLSRVPDATLPPNFTH